MCRPLSISQPYLGVTLPKLSRTVLGALILPIGLLPTAAWGETTATSTPAAVPTTEATPVATATVDPTAPADPTTPAESPTEGPIDLPPLGTFKFTPATGAPGSTITVSSVTACVDGKGVVGKKADVILLDTNADIDTDAALADEQGVDTAKDGSWTAKLTVPATAKSGDKYVIIAGCFYKDVETEPDTFLLYWSQKEFDFTVVAAPPAPVAKPVTEDPSFTG